MEKKSQTKQVLIRAANLLNKRKAWTQGMPARDKSGERAEMFGKDAVSYCVIGAIDKVVGWTSPVALRARNKLMKFLGISSLAKWNDAPKRKKKEVIAALRGAAATIK